VEANKYITTLKKHNQIYEKEDWFAEKKKFSNLNSENFDKYQKEKIEQIWLPESNLIYF
jgi:hypothetical protein